MSSCWSCTVLIEQGAKVCPFCGADQAKPVEFVNPHIPQPQTLRSSLHDWGPAIMVIVAAAGIISGILWHNFVEPSISPASQAAGIAAQSLQDLRAALSAYALSANDSYPAALISLGDRMNLPMQAALSAGYRLEYTPKSTSGASAARGFVILARPEKSDYPHLCIDESGVVRATQENRQATVQDPPL